MTIASYDKFIEPLLRLLATEPDGIRTSDAQKVLADQFGISQDERRELLPSGLYPVYKSRIGWAHDRLKRDGLSTSVRRGFWRITEKGLEYARRYPTLPATELRRLVVVARIPGSRTQTNEAKLLDSTTEMAEAGVEASSPDDRISDALNEIQGSLRNDLLDEIRARDPEFFEHLVLKVLRAMGYGTSDRALERSGGPGDEGIDGVISLDQLGLDKVYVQAKRYAEDSAVRKDAIHSFIGALHLQGANKGVFITTSRFTRGAEKAAEDVRALNLRLIGGLELSQLMITHQVGVRHEAIAIPKMDLDFWEGE